MSRLTDGIDRVTAIKFNEAFRLNKITGSEKRTLAVIGAGGHGKVIADIAEESGWDNVVFFDSGWPTKLTNGCWDIVGDDAGLFENIKKYDGFIVAIGNNNARYSKTKQLIELGANVITLIHPTAVISKYSSVGAGSVVAANAVINPFSTIGLAAIINTSSSVDHDCVLGDAVHICPGVRLAGGVNIENLCWIGIGSSIRQLISIGTNSTVGAGSVVVKDIPSNATAFGVPAKIQAV